MKKAVQFPLGEIVYTPGAANALKDAGDQPQKYIVRHAAGDWGEAPKRDAKQNDYGVDRGYMLHSSYTLGTGVKIWVITDADRTVTTILLPEEY